MSPSRVEEDTAVERGGQVEREDVYNKVLTKKRGRTKQEHRKHNRE